MHLSVWLAFVAAAVTMLIIPGPTISLVTSNALSQGRRSAAAAVAGVALGDLRAMSLSVLGLGAILAASATLFAVLKWIGTGYLIYLGVKLWRTPSFPQDRGKEAVPIKRMFGHAWLVTSLNPKGIVFFVAFVPQFIDPAKFYLPQAAILISTFVILATANSSCYALLASALQSTIRHPNVQCCINCVGGSVLAGSGLAAVTLKRTG